MTSTGMTPAAAGVPEPPSRLVSEWSAYGIVVAAARFLPVPLVDDALREQVTRVAVARTLRVHGRHYPASAVEPLYAGADAGGNAVLRYLGSVPRRVLLFPVRKYAAVIGSVKGVPTDVMTVLLLGRAVHRHLARGGLPDQVPTGRAGIRARTAEAAELRRAFDATLGEMDLRLLAGALNESLSRGKRLTRAAAQDVAGVMHRRAVADLLVEFDARVDARLG